MEYCELHIPAPLNILHHHPRSQIWVNQSSVPFSWHSARPPEQNLRSRIRSSTSQSPQCTTSTEQVIFSAYKLKIGPFRSHRLANSKRRALPPGRQAGARKAFLGFDAWSFQKWFTSWVMKVQPSPSACFWASCPSSLSAQIKKHLSEMCRGKP